MLETPSQCGTQVGIAGLQPVSIIRREKPQCIQDDLSFYYRADTKRHAGMLELAPADNFGLQIELPCVLSRGRKFESLLRTHAGTQRTSTHTKNKTPQLESDSQRCCEVLHYCGRWSELSWEVFFKWWQNKLDHTFCKFKAGEKYLCLTCTSL